MRKVSLLKEKRILLISGFVIFVVFFVLAVKLRHVPSRSLVSAVMSESSLSVRVLLLTGADTEEKNHKAMTPLLIAGLTDQYRLAELLIQSGANIFAVSKFGWNLGYMIQSSRLIRGPEFEARERVAKLLQERGFPHPAPDLKQTLELVAQNKWPTKAE